MWSERSVKSRYVRDEATYALDHDKLVPVAIESVKLPFRFRGVHTLSLLGWAGSKDFAEFRRLVADIAAIVDPASKRQEAQTADIRKNWLEPEMVVIPPGTFQMGDVRGIGSSSEKPVHEVIIPKPFAIGSTEVTFKEYDLFADATHREKPELPANQGRDRPPRPVINVSWNDAVEYAKWLSTRTGKRYRLPSEAEWEYAARSGGKEEIWSGTSLERELDGYAWYKPKSEGKTRQVGTKKPNALGLFDMSGNVWEWVEDGWHYDYKGAPTDGNAWVQGQSDEHVIRGGSWNYGPESLRTSGRSRVSTDIRRNDVGFRLAQDID
jgi:formylglycine-generating enzyme required for sulfatase activity